MQSTSERSVVARPQPVIPQCRPSNGAIDSDVIMLLMLICCLCSDEGVMEMMDDLSICTLCNRKFKNASQLRTHMIVHSSERKFKCNECGASFKLKSTLKSHELTHSLDKPFMCDVCFSTHCTKSGLAKHIESKHGTGERRFICEICGKMFLLKNALNNHIEYHNAKKVLCTVCGMLFFTESNLKKHVARIHELSVKKLEQKFECSHCARSFSSKRPLRFHMMTIHLKETPFQCLICDMKFPVKYKLDSHMVCHTEGKFKCMCGQSFTTKPSMERHSLTHINYRPYTCDWCGLTFTQKSSVERHIVVNMRGHYKRTGTCKRITGGRGGFYVSYRDLSKVKGPNGEDLSCTMRSVVAERLACSPPNKANRVQYPTVSLPDFRMWVPGDAAGQQVFSGISCFPCPCILVLQHTHLNHPHCLSRPCCKEPPTSLHSITIAQWMKNDEGLMEMMYDLSICTFCNRKFKYASRLRKHMIIHSSERKFKCNECGASFKVKSTLKSHELTHSLDKPFMCDVCFSTHCTKSGLAKHIESKHGTGERRFICEICGKMFLLKTVLNKHIEYHNAKKVLCTVCGMLFHTESYLKKHVARVHEFSVKKPEQKFECSHCARSFSSKRPLRFHMMTVHLKETPFQCLICDMKFPVKYKLDSHMVCHTEGKFKCMCGRSFTTKPSMERHSLTHINYRPYTCDWCGLTFTQKSSVERHIVVNMRGHYKRTGTCKRITGGRGGYYVSCR
ncbi:hypothetical protein PR048_028197 [Dryococelus australis]|uniref:C2H2-type domain-containing protein n=1 Tax=Dryococelus australis TaxID=614101 RepID=A0ABQ9GIM4_9NEOP|nr:hypothetical protein PR048_028197 [Dryococelus australis]